MVLHLWFEQIIPFHSIFIKIHTKIQNSRIYN